MTTICLFIFAEEMENKTTPTTAAVAPRNSLNMFTPAAERKPMSNLNNSKTSINSSTRSLQKDSPKTARRATTSTLGMNSTLKYRQKRDPKSQG